MTPEKRESAIAWLTDEIRSLRLAPTINGCDMKSEWSEQLEIMQTCLEAVKVCSVDTDKTSPLTLEQLREMKKPTPVWMESKKKTIEGWGGYWCLCAGGYIITPGCISMYADKMNEAELYAYPPAHIDREAWTAEWIYPENEFNLPRCSKCGCNSKDAQYGHKDNFCPKCGRAMTPEAWAMLEKRLRG